jgi:hypothetical protein
MAYFVQSIDLDMEKLDEEKGRSSAYEVLSTLLADLAVTSACADGSGYRIVDFECERCMSIWASGLVSSTEDGNVYM